MKKYCKYTHWHTVGKDNGASAYCLKEETRLEGPWEFGTKPLHQNIKGECKQARQEKFKSVMGTDLDKLCEDGDIDISQVPMLKRAKDIITAIRLQREALVYDQSDR